MKPRDKELIRVIHNYFHIYLPKQKCFSSNTVASYKYAFNLFLDYMRDVHLVTLSDLSKDDINCDNIEGFLDWLIEERKNASSTCNLRLMALRSFAKYLGLRDFSLSSIYVDVCAVPTKKTVSKVVEFLSEVALKELLNQPDASKPKGLRNLFFMILLYDTAARCQELLDLRVADFSFGSGAPFVYLKGKGNKIRTVPVMDATVKHLMHYLSVFHPDSKNNPDAHLFYLITHGVRHQISIDAIESFMGKYGTTARLVCSEVPIRVYPHLLRHTRAVHLYRAGMPLALLSEFLGHASIETTRRYAYADTEIKKEKPSRKPHDLPLMMMNYLFGMIPMKEQCES